MSPVLNQVLFKPFPPDEYSESGLLIPESVREVPDRGLIVKVGRGTKQKPMRLKEGVVAHRVHKWGEPIVIGGELHFLMDASAIIATE